MAPTGRDPFDTLYDRMQEQLDALRCALTIVEAAEPNHSCDDELTAALNLFRRTYQALGVLHNDFSAWHMRGGQP